MPYVAWTEDDGTNQEIRVARLNAAGTGWEKVGQTRTPRPRSINRAPRVVTRRPHRSNGVPYVAWSETDGTDYEIRVARLNAAGTAWEKVGNASSPINESNGFDGKSPASL